MKLDSQPPMTAIATRCGAPRSGKPIDSPSDLLDPLETINAMLDLRAQLAELQQQVEALQPAFYAACAVLKLEEISTDRATISRRLTPARWDYSDEIVEQEDLLKQLKSQFQQDHEPIGGREVYWMIKFLLASV